MVIFSVILNGSLYSIKVFPLSKLYSFILAPLYSIDTSFSVDHSSGVIVKIGVSTAFNFTIFVSDSLIPFSSLNVSWPYVPLYTFTFTSYSLSFVNPSNIYILFL